MDLKTAEEHSSEYVEIAEYNETQFATDQVEPETYTIQIDGEAEDTEVLSSPETEINSEIQEIEYLNAEEIDENNTIIIHDDKQYIIPTDKLRQAGYTIVLENGVEISNPEVEYDLLNQEICENIYYTDTAVENTVLNGQFAILKDGKLILDHGNGDSTNLDSENGSGNDEVDQKIRDFADTIHNFQEDDAETEDESLQQITGKNLLTGQKISLSGFLEKLKRKGLGDGRSGPRRSSYSPPPPKIGPDYVSVPPVNRRVVVGKTTNGKRLVGKILQIQKKLPMQNAADRTPRRQLQRTRRTSRSTLPRSQAPDSTSSPSEAVVTPNLPFSQLVDENVSRTLSGLMDLESVSKSLINRKLIIKHIQRRSEAGKILTGSRKTSFYSGNMQRNEMNQWVFVSNYSEQNQSGIDILESSDDQTINLKLEQNGFVSNTNTIQEVPKSEPEECINLFLTVTVDEFNKKRTKVSIPQLGQNSAKKIFNTELKNSPNIPSYTCDICSKKFQSAASLRRHFTSHNPDLRPLQCLQCLSRFTDESSLKKHLLLHSGIKPHSCSICSKSFAHKSDLNYHMKTHKSTKQYQCSICLKSFHRHSNMVRHQTIHQTNARSDGSPGNSGDNEASQDAEKYPPFCCEQCGSCFNFVSSLTRHIVTYHLISGEASASTNTLESS